MSIFTGKGGYDSTKMWEERSALALRTRGPLYHYDLGDEDKHPCIEWFKQELDARPGADVLEIGCGFGHWAKALDGHFKTYTGVDPILSRINHAAALYAREGVRFASIPGAYNLRRHFDVILCVTVIQHLALDKSVQVLAAIARHLKLDGVALLAEGRLWDITLEEAERRYAEEGNAVHMIPKPISLLKEAVPELEWEILGHGLFKLRLRP